MDMGESAEEAAFRLEAREWILEHGTAPGTRAEAEDLGEHVVRNRAWQATLHEHGWAGLSWPEAFGGKGKPSVYQSIFNEEAAAVDETTGSLTVALGMVAPTLMAHGTPAQQEHIPRMLRGEEMWCQLFSEPNAGSDLASLATRAVRDGDEWVVNGQKVWTSLGQFAEWGILLARTDVDVPKNKGITYFIVDMKSPGIEVRPLVQMTGSAHFNETFLTDVRIPAENVVGEVDGGWAVARTTLTSERGAIAGGNPGWGVPELIEAARAMGCSDDPVIRQGIARAHCRAETIKASGFRMRSAMSAGKMPGREALMMKLAYARHWAATADLGLEIMGADAMLKPTETGFGAVWPGMFLNQYAVRLGGGTDEVQQNIMGELGLGLPREPSTDRNVPWKDLPR